MRVWTLELVPNQARHEQAKGPSAASTSGTRGSTGRSWWNPRRTSGTRGSKQRTDAAPVTNAGNWPGDCGRSGRLGDGPRTSHRLWLVSEPCTEASVVEGEGGTVTTIKVKRLKRSSERSMYASSAVMTILHSHFRFTQDRRDARTRPHAAVARNLHATTEDRIT